MDRKLKILAAAVMLLTTGCSVRTPDTESSQLPAEPVTEAETLPPTEAPTEPPTEPPPSKAEEQLEKMDLHQKVCQMFIVTPEQLTGYDEVTYYDERVQASYDAFPVGGFILFDKNIIDPEQLTALNSDLGDMTHRYGIGGFISVDEEGGTISRVQWKLSENPVTDMVNYGSLNDYDAAFGAGAAIGQDLAAYGFNLDFAPVCDVNINPYNELGPRIFSTDPEIVSAMSAAVSDGLHSEGICSALKHFPGLGAGGANTHYGSVIIERSLEDLRDTEFKAFNGGIRAGADFVMVGHQITTGAEDDLPGDLSHKVITDWLRGELGFEGLVITDSHSMGAIADNYTADTAAVMAVQAGADMILMPNDTAAAVAGVENAVNNGDISEERINESVLRILEKKDVTGIL
ncbi:MAG TPA: hypothetical protein DCZ71_03080 [Ruminococcus sp.]|nr:hypothetical protein [Ruminococcus sp.]